MIKLNLRFFKRLPADEKKITLSTLFTLLRIALTPLIVVAMLWQQWGIACILFILASGTDLIDGALARYRNERTFLGACLDPIADKVLLVSCFATLAFVRSPLFVIPLWFVLVVLSKELLLIGGAFILYIKKGHLEIKPRILGKLTTVVQMGFIMWLFACYFFNWVPIKTYYTMLAILLILVCASFIQYAAMGISWLKKN